MNLFCLKICFNAVNETDYAAYIHNRINNLDYVSKLYIVNTKLGNISLTYAKNEAYSAYYNYHHFGEMEILTIGTIKQRNFGYVNFQNIIEHFRMNKYDVIISEYVGNYILILINNKKKDVAILKSPVCSINCYYTVDRSNNVVISSDLSFFMESFKTQYLPNVEYIKKYLASYFMHHLNCINTITPFEHVLNLANGTVVFPYRNEKANCIWYPNKKDLVEKIKDPESITTVFKEMFYDSLGEIISDIKTGSEVCIFLSGGYDSSAIACAVENILKNTEKNLNIKYLHYHYRDKGDELDFAKKVAEKTNRKLIVVEQTDGNALFENFLPLKSYIEPNEQILFNSIAPQNENLGDIFINGCGGDHLLLSSPESITGVLSCRNIKKWINLILSISNKKNISFFETVKRFLITPIKEKTNNKKACNKYLRDFFTDSFYKKYVVEARKNMVPKCYSDTLNQRNYESIYSGSMFPKEYNFSTILFQPFLQQELVEFCLNVPAFYKYDGDENRIFMKKAMEGLLPNEILERNNKSSNEQSMSEALKNNWDEISGFFENPVLEYIGVLKKGGIKKILKQLEMQCCLDIPNSIRMLTVEAWLREKRMKVGALLYE